MKEQNKCRCADCQCLEGIQDIRKIGLTPNEKRAIFHSILNLSGQPSATHESEELNASESLGVESA